MEDFTVAIETPPLIFTEEGAPAEGVVVPKWTKAAIPQTAIRVQAASKFFRNISGYFDPTSLSVGLHLRTIKNRLRESRLAALPEVDIEEKRPTIGYQRLVYKPGSIPKANSTIKQDLTDIGFSFPPEPIFVWKKDQLIVRNTVVVGTHFPEDSDGPQKIEVTRENIPEMALALEKDYMSHAAPFAFSSDQDHDYGKFKLRLPTEEPEYKPVFNKTDPDPGVLNIAYRMQTDLPDAGNIFNRLMTITNSYALMNGNYESMIARLRKVYAISRISRGAVEFNDIYEGEYDKRYEIFGFKHGAPSQLPTEKFIALVDQHWPRPEGWEVPGLGQSVPLSYEGRDGIKEVDSYVWQTLNPTIVDASLRYIGFSDAYKVSLKSGSGIITQSRPREETMFTDVNMTEELMKGSARLVGPLAGFTLGQLKPKYEIQKRSKLTGGVRNYGAYPSAAQIPLGIAAHAVFYSRPSVMNDPEVGGLNLIGGRIFGKGFSNLINVALREFKADPSKLNRFFVFSDNVFVFTAVRDGDRVVDVDFHSLDVSKMEASHTKHDTQAVAAMIVRDLGSELTFRKGKVGFNPLGAGGYYPSERGGQEAVVGGKGPVTNEAGVHYGWLRYIFQNLTALTVDSPVLLGKTQFIMPGTLSGPQLTAVNNQCKVTVATGLAIDLGCEYEPIVSRRPDSEPTFLEQSMWPGHHQGPYFDDTNLYLTPNFSTAFFCMGMKLEVTHSVPRLLGSLHSRKVVKADFLGNSLVMIEVLGTKHLLPILELERLLAALAFSKTDGTGKFSGIMKDFVAISKMKCLALIGGIFYEQEANLITSYLIIKYNQLARYIASQNQLHPDLRDLAETSMQEIAKSLSVELTTFFDSVGSVSDFLETMSIPVLYDIVRVLIDGNFTEKGIAYEDTVCKQLLDATVAAYIESPDEKVDELISVVPYDKILSLLLEEVIPGHDKFDEIFAANTDAQAVQDFLTAAQDKFQEAEEEGHKMSTLSELAEERRRLGGDEPPASIHNPVRSRPVRKPADTRPHTHGPTRSQLKKDKIEARPKSVGSERETKLIVGLGRLGARPIEVKTLPTTVPGVLREIIKVLATITSIGNEQISFKELMQLSKYINAADITIIDPDGSKVGIAVDFKGKATLIEKN